MGSVFDLQNETGQAVIESRLLAPQGAVTGDVFQVQSDGTLGNVTADAFRVSLGVPQLLGPYAVAYDTASLNAGVAFGYTPAIGDVFQPIVVVTTAFNGTTPLLDVGYTGDTNGFYYAATASNAALDVSATNATTAFDVAAALSLNASTPDTSVGLWARAIAADALLVWVSQDGTKGGAAIGGTAGAADLYVLTITPKAFA